MADYLLYSRAHSGDTQGIIGTVGESRTLTIPEQFQPRLSTAFLSQQFQDHLSAWKPMTSGEIDQLLRSPAPSVPSGAKKLTKASSRSGEEGTKMIMTFPPQCLIARQNQASLKSSLKTTSTYTSLLLTDVTSYLPYLFLLH